MAINAADQNTPVLVTDPLGNRHEVDAAHHGVADEVVAAIVETETFYTGQFPSFLECFFEATRRGIFPKHPRRGKEIG